MFYTQVHAHVGTWNEFQHDGQVRAVRSQNRMTPTAQTFWFPSKQKCPFLSKGNHYPNI